MIQTLVGRKGFRKGMELYVKRHDGQAVTCDDFVAAMAEAQSRLRGGTTNPVRGSEAQSSRAYKKANKIDPRQFMLWYGQAGTPVVTADSRYDAKAKTFTLTLAQATKPTPGQKTKKPLHIPFAFGLLDARGRDLIGTRVLSLKKPRETFVFRNIKSKPVPSLLRDFSAPVRLVHPVGDAELLFLLAHDSDAFNRWEASQKLIVKQMLAGGRNDDLIAALGAVIREKTLDPNFKSMMLALPGESELGLALTAQGKKIDPEALVKARKVMVRQLGAGQRRTFERLLAAFGKLDPNATDALSMGRRSLKNQALSYLAADEDPRVLRQVFRQASAGKNLTDQIAALGILAQTNSPLRKKALAAFARRWKKTPAIMDKWLAVQAGARRKNVLAEVKLLMKHPAFDIKNPNRVSALIGSFAGNPLGFHAKDGSGYRFLADMIVRIDALNPQSAAGLAKQFARWRDYQAPRRKLMLVQLRRLAARKLSTNSAEIVGRSLAAK
jgi:aminopeptidase N